MKCKFKLLQYIRLIFVENIKAESFFSVLTNFKNLISTRKKEFSQRRKKEKHSITNPMFVFCTLDLYFKLYEVQLNRVRLHVVKNLY